MSNTTPTTPSSDLVVVLDLDHTLIHSLFGKKVIDGLPENEMDFFMYTSYKRPHLNFFLSELSSRYPQQVHVFTAANAAYADPILDKLDPHGRIFTKRWYNDSCKRVNGNEDELRKNVLALDCSPLKINPKRFVLIDDRQDYLMDHLSNGILVSEFIVSRDDASDSGENVAKQDSSLLKVLDLLKQLDEAEDVRPLLDQKFNWSLIQSMADMNMEATAL